MMKHDKSDSTSDSTRANARHLIVEARAILRVVANIQEVPDDVRAAARAFVEENSRGWQDRTTPLPKDGGPAFARFRATYYMPKF